MTALGFWDQREAQLLDQVRQHLQSLRQTPIEDLLQFAKVTNLLENLRSEKVLFLVREAVEHLPHPVNGKKERAADVDLLGQRIAFEAPNDRIQWMKGNRTA